MSGHHPTITTSRASAAVVCACGWSASLFVKNGRPAIAASLAFAQHLRDARKDSPQ